MPYRDGGSTNTGQGLRKVIDEYKAHSRSDSMGYPKATVLITDGSPTDGTNAVSAAKEMTNAGITMFTIGIGNVIRDNLQEIGLRYRLLEL